MVRVARAAKAPVAAWGEPGWRCLLAKRRRGERPKYTAPAPCAAGGRPRAKPPRQAKALHEMVTLWWPCRKARVGPLRRIHPGNVADLLNAFRAAYFISPVSFSSGNMKNLLKNAGAHGVLALALLAAPNHPAHAQTVAPPMGVQQTAPFSYRVWASNPGAQPGTLRLINASTGAVLYQEYSARPSFGRKFNVSNLPDGSYAFVVTLGRQQFRYALRLRTTSQRSAELAADTARGRLAARL